MRCAPPRLILKYQIIQLYYSDLIRFILSVKWDVQRLAEPAFNALPHFVCDTRWGVSGIHL